MDISTEDDITRNNGIIISVVRPDKSKNVYVIKECDVTSAILKLSYTIIYSNPLFEIETKNMFRTLIDGLKKNDNNNDDKYEINSSNEVKINNIDKFKKNCKRAFDVITNGIEVKKPKGVVRNYLTLGYIDEIIIKKEDRKTYIDFIMTNPLYVSIFAELQNVKIKDELLNINESIEIKISNCYRLDIVSFSSFKKAIKKYVSKYEKNLTFVIIIVVELINKMVTSSLFHNNIAHHEDLEKTITYYGMQAATKYYEIQDIKMSGIYLDTPSGRSSLNTNKNIVHIPGLMNIYFNQNHMIQHLIIFDDDLYSPFNKITDRIIDIDYYNRILSVNKDDDTLESRRFEKYICENVENLIFGNVSRDRHLSIFRELYNDVDVFVDLSDDEHDKYKYVLKTENKHPFNNLYKYFIKKSISDNQRHKYSIEAKYIYNPDKFTPDKRMMRSLYLKYSRSTSLVYAINCDSKEDCPIIHNKIMKMLLKLKNTEKENYSVIHGNIRILMFIDQNKYKFYTIKFNDELLNIEFDDIPDDISQ